MRQAVSLAIDRKDLVQALYLNYAEPTANLLNYTSPYYKDYPVEYDPEKARKLAREVLGGQRCEVVYCINGGEPLQKGEAELISYWLQSIGSDVSIQSLEYGPPWPGRCAEATMTLPAYSRACLTATPTVFFILL